jgi:hypothetical protein
MSSGYTYCVEQGASFGEFVLKCARAFDFLTCMRDQPLDAKIPDKFEPSTYHKDELEIELARLVQFDTVDPVTLQNKYNKYRDKLVAGYKTLVENTRVSKSKYTSMLDKVIGWTPPTEKHECLKEFMINQLSAAIKNLDELVSDTPLSYTDWLEEERKRIAWYIDYHTKEYAGAIERAEQTTTWVKQLRDSLKREEE